MAILFFDTETTGFPKPSIEDPAHAMPVQIAYKLDDDACVERMSCSTLIKTGGEWEIGAKAQEIHGISAEQCDAYGVPLESAMRQFGHALMAADLVVAHNIKFDMAIVRRAFWVACQRKGAPFKDPFANKPVYCTLQNAIHAVNLPGRNGQPKWPKLEECMQHFFGESIVGAHDALVDTRACARVYYRLREEENGNEANAADARRRDHRTPQPAA